jgi:hypothetical protein
MEWEVLGRDAVGVFLLASSLTKALDVGDSVAALSLHVPLRIARFAVPWISVFEAALAAAIISGYRTTLFLTVASGTFIAFAIVQGVWLREDGDALRSCACFGLGIPSVISRFGVFRNFATAALCGVLAASQQNSGVTSGLPASTFAWLLPAALALPLLVLNLSSLETIRTVRHRGARAGASS